MPWACENPPPFSIASCGGRAAWPGIRLSSDTFIEIDHVTFGYDPSRPILSDLSLKFQRGKVTSILGGSGCGKTTLMRLVAGVHATDRGRVVFDGEVVDVHNREQLYRLRRRLGMLFQFGALFTDLNVFDNVAFPLREHTDLPEAMIRDIVLMKLNAVGLRGGGLAAHQRSLGRHGAAHRAGARHRAGPRTHHLRRALCRPGPDLHGCGRQAHPHAQRRHRRDLARHLARRARVHGHSTPASGSA